MERKAYPRFVFGFEQLFIHWVNTACRLTDCKQCQQCMDITGYGVSIIMRVLLLEMNRLCEGSNLTLFLRPLLSKKQCQHMITKNQLIQEQGDTNNTESIGMNQWSKFNTMYFPNLNLSILFPKCALLYLPFLCYNDTFHVLHDLYKELFQSFPLSLRGKTFAMLLWHLNGLLALNPGFVETMWGESLESNLIVWMSLHDQAS